MTEAADVYREMAQRALDGHREAQARARNLSGSIAAMTAELVEAEAACVAYYTAAQQLAKLAREMEPAGAA